MSTQYQPNRTDNGTNGEKVKRGDARPSVLTHGLQHLQHLPSDDPVRHVTHSEGPAAAVLSLHGGGVVRTYRPDGQLCGTLQSPVEYTGLTGTKLLGRVAGWGPGSNLALLDGELRPVAHAPDPLDVRACQTAERSMELVTAGAGNVCVWCLYHLRCKVRVQEGLGPDDAFTLLALAPPTAGRHHRAFAVCGSAVALVDLTEGRLLEKRRSLHQGEITSLVHCPLLDCLVTASQDTSIRVWGPDWDPLITFVSHTGVVTALACCPVSGQIISASLDGTLRCWSLEEEDQVQLVHVEGGAPPLGLGGPGAGGTFYSFSERGVDLWGMSSLYHLHCRLGADGYHGGPVRQIVVPRCPPPYPPRALCVSGHRSLALVDVETGAVLTSFVLGAGRRVRAADYCLHKETLLVLTAQGAVLRASALTNPATGLDDWRGTWEEPWPRGKRVDGEGDGWRPGPGPASCLALYNAVTDHKEALEDWQELRELGDLRAIKRRSRLDARNWSAFLLPVWEDKAVQVWRVCPLSPDCLSPLLSLSCGQPPLHLATLGSLLALALEEPHSATYRLLHLCLETQSSTDHQPSQGHLDYITGVCACPQMGVLASSSRDGTIRIWDDENRLLRILQLNAEPECLAYCGQRGDLLLGIKGDLYRIPKTQLLPHDLHIQLLYAEQLDPIPGLLISKTRPHGNTHSIGCVSSCVEDEETHSEEEETTDTEYTALLARCRDLQTLQQGAAVLGGKKKKLPMTRRTKKEAFARYLKLVFPEPLKVEIPDEFDLQGALFPPRRPAELHPRTPPGGGHTNASIQRSLLGHIPNSVLLGQLWPGALLESTLPQRPWALREGLGQLDENDVGEVTLLVCDDDDDDDDDEDELHLRHLLEKQDTIPRQMSPPPPAIPPIEERARFRAPKRPLIVPPPPIPEFLSPFVDQDWFQEVFPDGLLHSSLSPEDFALLLLQTLKCCQAGSRTHILDALLQLLRKGALKNSKQICAGLMDLLQIFATSDMLEERHFVYELLKAVVSVGSNSTDTMVELLTILAHRELGLQRAVLCLLKSMGVEEAELWLSSEVASWHSRARWEPNTWAHLRQVAARWLDFWTCKYKDRALFLKGAEKKQPITPVEILRFFCSVQREKQNRPPPLPPEGRKDTVLLHQHLHRKPILRLGETHSLTRTRQTQRATLPPLCHRPLLEGFVPFITLPLPRISLCPFPCLDELCPFPPQGAPSRRYFIPEHSCTHYYR
ncbi:hypothetical protein SKAU_G00088980 [Synaphobranchus kaupii]|uniref:WD repeat-containing protein 97 n=1 Tax=Synaphobranchus kaupii TaxID=118154 RepID=A0A9Q1FWB0_SYNKA|nr:hypothetical protein SKAU_G00088980 [Synaphobranchus kaupii]